ncbi:MAG: ankyrin repeat domain-containing protein [Acidobacteria bacterium]|nr:ankyrin repeat domain-containing protein [Acidobacteriota bacterium]
MAVRLSKNMLLDPCNENWFQMQGNDSVRFCSHCAKHVHNLEAWDAEQVESWLQQQAAPVCVRVLPHRQRIPQISDRRLVRKWLNRFFLMSLGGLSLQAQTVIQGPETAQVAPLKTPQEEPIVPSSIQLNAGPHRIFGNFSVLSQKSVEADDDSKSVQIQVEVWDGCQQLVTRAALDDKFRFEIAGLASGVYELRLIDGQHQPQPLNLELLADEALDVDVVESYNLLYSVLGTVTYEKTDFGNKWVFKAHDTDAPQIDKEEEDLLKNLALELDYADLATVNKMISNGDLDPTLGRSHGLTLLLYCLATNKADAALALLEAGADPHLKTFKQVPTFLFAICMGEPTVIKKFLAMGVDPNSADRDGHTALMIAAFYGNEPVMKMLIKAGADPDQLDHDGFDALFYAEQNCQADLARSIFSQHK